MKIENNVGKFKGLCIFTPERYEDERGWFTELLREEHLNVKFVQENESYSKKGVLRGLHYQKEHPQGKLVRVTQGMAFDVVVDLREDSSTYGKWYGVILSDMNNRMMYIPEGFAHGFMALSDEVRFNYKCTDYYYPDDQYGYAWDSPALDIAWPITRDLIMSEKDMRLPRFEGR